jgi:DNA segregation ATPase FtsK/SpoIIIE-like protein
MFINKETVCSAEDCGQIGTIDKTGLCPDCLLAQVELDMQGDTATQDDREFTERLVVELTDDEIIAYADELTDLIVERGKIEAERSVLNKKMKPMTDRVEELAPIIHDKKEERPVDCSLIYQWDRHQKIKIRNDTDEIIMVQEIPDFERQQHLDLDKSKKDEEQLLSDQCDDEEMMLRALGIISKTGQASISIIQRNLRIGYNRAARLVEAMEAEMLIGPSDGTGLPREIFTDKINEILAEAEKIDDAGEEPEAA